MKLRLAITLILSSIVLNAASVTLVWDPSVSTGVTGYRVYYGTPAGNYSFMHDCGNSTNTTITNLVAGSNYTFYATCYNLVGLESEPSNVVSYDVPSDQPQPAKRTLRGILGMIFRTYKKSENQPAKQDQQDDHNRNADQPMLTLTGLNR